MGSEYQLKASQLSAEVRMSMRIITITAILLLVFQVKLIEHAL